MSKESDKAIILAEVLPPMPPTLIDERKLDELVSQRIEKILADEKSAILEPFMRSKRISIAIRKEQDVIQLNKWRYYFDNWGCLDCKQRDAGYGAIGLCRPCYGRVAGRMRQALQHAYENSPTFDKPRDLAELAREALAPALKVRETVQTEKRQLVNRALPVTAQEVLPNGRDPEMQLRESAPNMKSRGKAVTRNRILLAAAAAVCGLTKWAAKRHLYPDERVSDEGAYNNTRYLYKRHRTEIEMVIAELELDRDRAEKLLTIAKDVPETLPANTAGQNT